MVSGASLCQSQSNCPKSEDSRVTFHRAPLWLGPPLFKFNCCTATSMHLFVQLSRSHPIKFLSFPFNSNHLTPKNHKKTNMHSIFDTCLLPSTTFCTCFLSTHQKQRKNRKPRKCKWRCSLARGGVERRGDVECAFSFFTVLVGKKAAFDIDIVTET